MAVIGFQPDLNTVNSMLGDAAVTVRDAAARIERIWSYLEKVGVAGLQAPPYSLAEADAQALYDKASQMHTLAALYYGAAAQPDPYDFDDALALVRGGS